MIKGQLNLVFFIISFLILVLVIVLLPVINVFIDNTLGDGSISTPSSSDSTVTSNIEYYGIKLFPILMVLCSIAGFFLWSGYQ